MAEVSPLFRSKYKVVFLGDESVGKTNILKRFVHDKFDTSYQVTTGMDFSSKTAYVGDRAIRLQLWDTAGQGRFRSLIPSYIRGATVAVIVYDVTNRQSFLNTANWIEEVRKELGTDAILVLVGNNVDLADKRQVSIEEGDDKAREFGAMFIETSAKAGLNIKPLFLKIVFALPEMKTLLSKKQEDMVEQKEDMDAAKHKDIMEVDDQRTEEMQEVERRCQYCGRFDGQRCEDMVKWFEDLLKRGKDGNRRAKETIKEVEERLDDIKRWADMSNRLVKIHGGMITRLEELQSQIIRNHQEFWTTYRESYDPLKIFQPDVDDHVVSVTKLNKRKLDNEIQKMEEDKHDLKEQNLES